MSKYPSHWLYLNNLLWIIKLFKKVLSVCFYCYISSKRIFGLMVFLVCDLVNNIRMYSIIEILNYCKCQFDHVERFVHSVLAFTSSLFSVSCLLLCIHMAWSLDKDNTCYKRLALQWKWYFLLYLVFEYNVKEIIHMFF